MVRFALAALRALVLLLTGGSVPVFLVLVFVSAMAMLLGLFWDFLFRQS